MKDTIRLNVCQENIASCNSCGSRNYVSSVDKRPADVDVLFELHIGNMCNRLCKDCLKKIEKEISEAKL